MNDLKIIDRREEKQEPVEQSFFAIVERLSMRPDMPVEKIKQIMDMQEHILDRNEEQAYNAAMVRVQANLKVVLKTKRNQQTNSDYAPLEDIIQFASPIYTAEGFSLSFYEGETSKPDHIRVVCDVMHEAGHTKTRFGDFAVDIAGIKGTTNKTPIHAEASTFTYGRRYLTCRIFNIPTGDDDDGQSAGPAAKATESSKWFDMCNESAEKGLTELIKFWNTNNQRIKKECSQLEHAKIYQLFLDHKKRLIPDADNN